MSAGVAPGRRVVLHLSLALRDGSEVESTFGGEPLDFELGDGTLDRGLEARLEGLAPGQHATFHLEPGEAFGDPDPAAVQPMPRGEFPADMDLAPGTVVGFTTPRGDELAGTVMEVTDNTVVMDFNHPLAGISLVLTVEVLSTG